MKNPLPLVGLGLLLACFAFSAARLFLRPTAPLRAAGDVVHLRFAHVTLHEGVVAAYDEAAREYERLNPGVRVEQILVPLKLWPSWLRTQMIGGTAPDIADMDRGHGDEFVARHFLPLGAWTEQPNPYNAGTALEGVAWRDTFIDGLSNAPAYRPAMQQVYGIPHAVGISRVFANADLLRTINGTIEPPRDYAAFMALCARIRAYAQKHGLPLVPIAGSQGHAPPILRHLFSSQTQRLALEINPYKSLETVPRDVALAYLRGDWRWDRPAVLAGAGIVGEVGRQFVAGFSQLRREDSMLHFAQGRAVMLATGSWEADTVRLQAPFELAVFEVPVPGRDDPRFGRNVLGPVSELGVPPANAMGVSRSSPHAERAVDFLRFLTSLPGAQRATARGNRLSSVLGVVSPPEMEAFAPLEEGWPAGFSCELTGVAPGGGGECVRVYQSHFHELVGPRGSPERFARAMDRDFEAAVRADLSAALADGLRNSRTDDGALVGFRFSGDPSDAARASRLLEGQTFRELEAAQIRYGLRHWGSAAR